MTSPWLVMGLVEKSIRLDPSDPATPATVRSYAAKSAKLGTINLEKYDQLMDLAHEIETPPSEQKD